MIPGSSTICLAAIIRKLGKKTGKTISQDVDIARAGSPILDLKPYIPGGDAIPGAVTPGWLMRSRPPTD